MNARFQPRWGAREKCRRIQCESGWERACARAEWIARPARNNSRPTPSAYECVGQARHVSTEVTASTNRKIINVVEGDCVPSVEIGARSADSQVLKIANKSRT